MFFLSMCNIIWSSAEKVLGGIPVWGVWVFFSPENKSEKETHHLRMSTVPLNMYGVPSLLPDLPPFHLAASAHPHSSSVSCDWDLLWA